MNKKSTLRSVANDYLTHPKKEKGITLIALAVTIIVMLILAGVTIAALTSENGIINQANIVKEKNKVAKTEEEAKLEYSNLILEKQMEGHGEETELSDVIEKLEENGYETGEKDGKNYIKIGEYYYEIKLENAQVSIAKERTEGITVGSSKITAKKIAQTADKTGIYGEKVTNYTCPNTTGVSTWRIFYADTENIYLIANDYINIDNVPKKEKIVDNDSSGNHSRLSMQNVLSDYPGGATSIDSIIANKWLSSYWKNNSTSTNSNIKAVAYMLDTNAWNTLYKGENAEYAIGGPTLEMFVKSWNDTHKGHKQIGYEAESNSNGYKVKFAYGSYDTYINGLAQNEYNSIYIKSDYSNADAMCLASPSANNNYSLMRASYNGHLSNRSYSDNSLGFRPVVCLKSKVKLQKVVDGYEIR